MNRIPDICAAIDCWNGCFDDEIYCYDCNAAKNNEEINANVTRSSFACRSFVGAHNPTTVDARFTNQWHVNLIRDIHKTPHKMDSTADPHTRVVIGNAAKNYLEDAIWTPMMLQENPKIRQPWNYLTGQSESYKTLARTYLEIVKTPYTFGLIFGPNDHNNAISNLVCLDLDNVRIQRDSVYHLSEATLTIIDALSHITPYTEISFSNRGLHIVFACPDIAFHNVGLVYDGKKIGQIFSKHKKSTAALTGICATGSMCSHVESDTLIKLFPETFAVEKPIENKNISRHKSLSVDTAPVVNSPWKNTYPADAWHARSLDELLKFASVECSWKPPTTTLYLNDEPHLVKWKSLTHSDGSIDYSVVDFVLIKRLLRVCGMNEQRVYELMIDSDLERDKWHLPINKYGRRTTYLIESILNARLSLDTQNISYKRSLVTSVTDVSALLSEPSKS